MEEKIVSLMDGKHAYNKLALRHQMVSGPLALLYILLGFHGGRQGSGPDKEQSPVEWGDFLTVRPSVRPSVHSFIRPPLWAIQLGLRPSQPGLRPSQPGLRPRQPASTETLWLKN